MTEYGAGAVWWGLLDFGDGAGDQKKYIVLLTDCEAEGELFLAALATSKGDKRFGAGAWSPSPCGCPDSNFFRIEAGQEDCFPVTTWVQVTHGGQLSRAKLDGMVKLGRAGFVQTLSSERTRSMLNCAKKSQDITKRDLERIDRALKARNPAKKTNPPKPTTPVPLVSPEVASVRTRIDRCCARCRASLIELLDIGADKLGLILQGKEAPPDGFISNIEAGLGLLVEAGCASCPKSG